MVELHCVQGRHKDKVKNVWNQKKIYFAAIPILTDNKELSSKVRIYWPLLLNF